MWKKDENGNLVADDKGNPILITADGKEEGFSLEANKQHISSINAESASRRKEIDSLKEQLKPFEGLDPTKAREAIEKVKSFSEKDLVDTGKVEEIKAEMKRVHDAQLSEATLQAEQYKQQMQTYIVGQSFGDSKFINEKLNIPADMVRSYFGSHFTVDANNKVVALHDPSNPNSVVYSDANGGEPASFDEALAKFVNAYPNKDQILKSSGNQGGGTSAGEYSGSRKWDDYTEAERVHLAKTNPEGFKNLQKTQGK